jgi:hypothetical protein
MSAMERSLSRCTSESSQRTAHSATSQGTEAIFPITFSNQHLTSFLSAGERKIIDNSGNSDWETMMKLGDIYHNQGDLLKEGENHREVQDDIEKTYGRKHFDSDSRESFAKNSAIMHHASVSNYGTFAGLSFSDCFIWNGASGKYDPRPGVKAASIKHNESLLAAASSSSGSSSTNFSSNAGSNSQNRVKFPSPSAEQRRIEREFSMSGISGYPPGDPRRISHRFKFQYS